MVVPSSSHEAGPSRRLPLAGYVWLAMVIATVAYSTGLPRSSSAAPSLGGVFV